MVVCLRNIEKERVERGFKLKKELEVQKFAEMGLITENKV